MNRTRIGATLAVLILLLAAGPAAAYTLSLSATDQAGTEKTQFQRGEDLYLHIEVDDPAGIAGAAFTLVYDPAFLTAPATSPGGTPVNSGDLTSSFPFSFQSGEINEQTHRENSDTANARILFAGAAIDESTGGAPGGSSTSLFTVRFTVNGDAAQYSPFAFQLAQTMLWNPLAGYGLDASDNPVTVDRAYDPGNGDQMEPVPVLVGALPNTDPNFNDLALAFPELVDNLPVTKGGLEVIPCPDTDADGLCNDVETNTGTYVGPTNTGTSPSDSDSDNDGLSDGNEVNTQGTDPTDSDTDNDGIPDGYEVSHNLNPLVNDATADADSDGLSNLAEYQNGCTDPSVADTDADGKNDGAEVAAGSDPCVADQNVIALDMDDSQDGIQATRFINPGERVTVLVWAKNVTDLSGVDFVVNFDQTKLAYVSAGEPAENSFLKSAGGTTVYPGAITTDTTVALSGAILGFTAQNSPDGSGVIGQITFDVAGDVDDSAPLCLTFGDRNFSRPDSSQYEPSILEANTCLSVQVQPGDFTDESGVCGGSGGTPDGCVNFNDLLLFAATWGKTQGDDGWCGAVNEAPAANPEDSEMIDFDDLLIFAANWGQGPGCQQ